MWHSCSVVIGSDKVNRLKGTWTNSLVPSGRTGLESSGPRSSSWSSRTLWTKGPVTALDSCLKHLLFYLTFIYVAMTALSCRAPDDESLVATCKLSCCTWGLGFLTNNWTLVPCTGSTESAPGPLRKSCICYFCLSAFFYSDSDGKESACSAGDSGSNPGSGRSPGEGNGNPHQYSYLGAPMDRGAWQVIVPSVAESNMTKVT